MNTKKAIFLTFCIIMIPAWIVSQENYSMEKDKVTQYEMDMTEYPDDNEAEAVVIFDKGDYRFEFSDTDGLLLNMTFHTKIKILSQAGEKYATFELPIYNADSRSYERLENVSGATYNLENGNLEKTNLDTRNKIFEEKINNNWKLKRFTLPNIKVGSVIEVKYSIKTPFFVNMREWKFQKKIPVVYSQLKYRAIPYYEYVYSISNINKLDEQSSTPLIDEIRHRNLVYKEMEHIFGLKRIPAFKDEQFVSSSKDYMITLNFQLARIYYPKGGQKDYISTWEALTKDLQKNTDFGKYINDAKKEAKKILSTLNINNKTEREKITIISDYVKHNFNWNGSYGKYASQKTSNFLKTRRGNVADINLFLTGMLSEAKINADPIILSTRNHGKINKSYPFMQYFNYTMVQVEIGGSILFIDATEPMLPDRVVPSRCANTEALIVSKEPKWIFVRQRILSFLQKELDITIHNNSMEVKAQYGSTGLTGYNYRTRYLSDKENFSKYLNKTEGINISGDIKFTDFDKLKKPFRFDFTFNVPKETNNDKIFVNPFVRLFSKNNIFKQSTRTHPIDMNELIRRRFFTTIHIPDGYEVEFLPKTMTLENEVMKIQYQSEIADNAIKIDLNYNFKDYIYPAEQYQLLKDSYAELLTKLTEMVVLKKK